MAGVVIVLGHLHLLCRRASGREFLVPRAGEAAQAGALPTRRWRARRPAPASVERLRQRGAPVGAQPARRSPTSQLQRHGEHGAFAGMSAPPSSLLRWFDTSARVPGARRIRSKPGATIFPARSFYNELGYHEIAVRRGRYSNGVGGVVLEK